MRYKSVESLFNMVFNDKYIDAAVRVGTYEFNDVCLVIANWQDSYSWTLVLTSKNQVGWTFENLLEKVEW